MSPAAAVPRTFTEVPGWREAFQDAAERLDHVRTGSLFPDLPLTLCGQRVRPLTLADWTVLDQADNPFVAGGVRTVAHAANIVWLLSPRWRRDCRFARFLRGYITRRILQHAACDELGIIEDVGRFVDDAFLDAPGVFSGTPENGGSRSPVNWPRKAMEVELCAEIMAQFPGFTFEGLRRMPLPLFWQWLHEARSKWALAHDTKYRNYQLTDSVNTAACAELNRLRKEAAEAAKSHGSE